VNERPTLEKRKWEPDEGWEKFYKNKKIKETEMALTDPNVFQKPKINIYAVNHKQEMGI
jgi:hypothetical protein